MLVIERGTWREELRARYPIWTGSLVRGVEVGEGWRVLVENYFTRLDERLGGEAGCPNFRLMQVKEKFGLLRIYLSDVPEDAQAEVIMILDHAVRASSVTSEVCGRSGILIRTGGWLRVRCVAHDGMHADHYGPSCSREGSEIA